MYDSDRMYLSKFSHTDDYDPYLEENYYQELELDGEFNRIMEMNDLDETDDFFFEEN